MSNKNYLFDGSQLFRVIKSYKNLINVIPTKEHLTRQIAKRTYAVNQLESLGYIILESRVNVL